MSAHGPARFAGSVVALTGAASGIGRATALQLAAAGARLALADLDGDGLADLSRELARLGARARTDRVDVGDREAVLAWAHDVRADLGPADVLVNGAGVGLLAPIVETAHEHWTWAVRTNYWGVVHGLQAFLPGMLARGRGHVVNVASANGLFAFPYGGVYASTKFAIVGLSEALRAELAPRGIGVSVVCPGMTRTAILERARFDGGVAERSRLLRRFRQIFERRAVGPDVIAHAIVRAVARNRAVVRAPGHVRAVDALHRLAPGLYRAAIARAVRGDAIAGEHAS